MTKNKRKMTKKQRKTLEKMKRNRQIDSNNLREVIKEKFIWAQNEKKKGLQQIETLKIQIERLNGIILFVKDLFEPKENKSDKSKT